MSPSKRAFTRRQRLTQSSEFTRVFADAERSSDRFFTVLARSSSTDAPRLGLTISRRAARKAVDRNRLKRLTREAFRQMDHARLDFVVMAKGAAIGADNRELRQSLENHFMRLSRRAARQNDG